MRKIHVCIARFQFITRGSFYALWEHDINQTVRTIYSFKRVYAYENVLKFLVTSVNRYWVLIISKAVSKWDGVC